MSPIRMQRLESAMRVVLEYVEAFNRHDVARLMLLIGDDCVYEDAAPAPDGAAYSGKESLSLYFHDLFEQTAHAHIEIEEIFGLGSRCILRRRYEWTDAVGTKNHIRMIDVYKLENDRIREVFSYIKS